MNIKCHSRMKTELINNAFVCIKKSVFNLKVQTKMKEEESYVR